MWNRTSSYDLPRRYLLGIGIILLSVYTLTHFWVLNHFNFIYSDSDQPYMWAAWLDYSGFKFYEPRFYGQNYNTHFEALVAQLVRPFTKNPIQAIALATHFISWSFTVISACILWYNDFKLQTIMWLGFWVCMPAEYDLLCALPRGFVSGFPFLLPALPLLIKSPNDWRRRIAILIFTFGLCVHPGIIIVVLPIMVFVYVKHNILLKILKIDFLFFIAFLFVGILVLDAFYFLHPNYIQNDLKSNFLLFNFLINIQRLDVLWSYVSPIFTSQALWLLLTIFTIWLFSKTHARFYALASVMGILLFSLCSEKSLEGSNWLFMPFSRLYIYLPVFTALGLILITKPKVIVVLLFFVVALSNNWYKITYAYHQAIQKALNPQSWVGVRVFSNTQLKSTFNFYARALKSNHCKTLCVASTHWLKNPISYGLRAYCNMPNWYTTDGATEKRYWIRQQSQYYRPKQFLYQSSNFSFKNFKTPVQFKLKALDDFGLVYVYNNTFTLKQFQDWAAQYEL